MTLKELGRQYEEQEKRLRLRIAELRLCLRDCGKEEEARKIRCKLLVFYEMARECRETAETLINYYRIREYLQ